METNRTRSRWAIRRPSLGVVFALFLLLFAGLAAYTVFGFMILLPVPLLIGWFLGFRVFTNPVLVLCLFLTVAVNLDYFHLGGALNADILMSSFLLYAMMLRTGLSRRPLFENRVERIYLIYLVAIIPSVMLSMEVGNSFKNWFRDVEFLILLHFVTGLGLHTRERRAITGAIILSSIIPLACGVAGMMFNIPDFYGSEAPTGLEGSGELVARVSSTLAHPGMFSQYICTVGVLTLGMIVDGRWFRRRYLVPLFLVQVVLLYFGYTRAMWLEFLIECVIIFWLLGYRRVVLAGIPVGLVGLAVLVPSFIARWQTVFTADSNNSMIWRLGLWLKALSLYPNHPIFGSGPDTFIDYVDFLGFGAHNTWLKLLVETGIVGLVGYVAVLVAVYKLVRRKLRVVGPRLDPLVVPTFAILIGHLVTSMVSDTFEIPPANIYLWTLLAMVFAWTGHDPEPDGAEAPVPASGEPEAPLLAAPESPSGAGPR